MIAPNSPYGQLKQAIIDVLVFFAILIIVSTVVIYTMPILMIDYWDNSFANVLMSNMHRVGNICFGILLMAKLRNHRALAISIGILGAMYPLIGGLFYLMIKAYGASKLA